uniref:Vav guanine nucleotide exchange factor 3 n=1 Tax=Cyprinus carpio TaxID=7962 RepID=A0A8C1UNV2_CYPCA
MEHWRQCALWLINCKVLPPNHRVTWESAQVFDLAQTLRDGVLLCQLLNNLRPLSINLRQINLRPQMSQFLCLKNIRTFLHACSEIFGMKKSELFEAFDLFDVRDFGKSAADGNSYFISLSFYSRPFPTEESVEDEDIYNHLEDLIDENGVEDEEDLYDCVYDDDEGGEVYEDLMKVELVQPQKQAETDIRSCCLMEIKQTEEKYTETLDSIEKFFMKPLGQSLSSVEIEKVFINIPDLVKVHTSLLREVQDSVLMHNANNLFQIFINYKERLVLYGKYCSQVESAIASLDDICKNREDVRQMLEVRHCQTIFIKHLGSQVELVKHTHDATDKSNLRQALDAMKDLAQYVNEVKRDIETLRDIDQYQKSIENLNQSLRNYGRPKGDSEVRVASVDKRAKQDRHIFLFDAAVIVCKRRGDNYEMKEVIDLHSFKITNNPTSDRENRKWCHGFYLTHNQGQNGFEFFFKTKEVKKKWLEQFGMALSNICPESGKSNFHEFRMHTFETTTSCSSCKMLLRVLATKEVGFFPSDAVKPCPCVSTNTRLYYNAKMILYSLPNKTNMIKARGAVITRVLRETVQPDSAASILSLFVWLILSDSHLPFCPVMFASLFFLVSTVFTPKVMGVAIARYDFSSRDTRELSLQEGDVVKIYSKTGANGWWRGEVNGRVSVNTLQIFFKRNECF